MQQLLIIGFRFWVLFGIIICFIFWRRKFAAEAAKSRPSFFYKNSRPYKKLITEARIAIFVMLASLAVILLVASGNINFSNNITNFIDKYATALLAISSGVAISAIFYRETTVLENKEKDTIALEALRQIARTYILYCGFVDRFNAARKICSNGNSDISLEERKICTKTQCPLHGGNFCCARLDVDIFISMISETVAHCMATIASVKPSISIIIKYISLDAKETIFYSNRKYIDFNMLNGLKEVHNTLSSQGRSVDLNRVFSQLSDIEELRAEYRRIFQEEKERLSARA